MSKQKKLPEKLRVWVEARKKHKLNHMQVQMARELGLNPKKLGRIDNHKQDTWKLPLPQHIEELYEEHFGKTRPDNVLSIEERFAEQQQKKAERAERKRIANEANQVETQPSDGHQPEGKGVL